MSAARKYESTYARLVARSCPEHDGVNACWIWQGTKSSVGYGRFTERVPGKQHPQPVWAHRAMAAIVQGREIDPDAETVEHLCANTSCVNPDHLTLMSRADNSRAMWARRRAT